MTGCCRHNTIMFHVVFAVWSLWLGRYVVIGVDKIGGWLSVSAKSNTLLRFHKWGKLCSRENPTREFAFTRTGKKLSEKMFSININEKLLFSNLEFYLYLPWRHPKSMMRKIPVKKLSLNLVVHTIYGFSMEKFLFLCPSENARGLWIMMTAK